MSDFAEVLTDYLSRLGELRRKGASEASIRDEFLRFLRTAFPRINEAEPFELEKHVPALRVRGGFADALFGDLIFEFKRKLDEAHRAEGMGQLQQYLVNQDRPERFFGILSDGETVEVYTLREGRIISRDQLVLRAEEAERCKLWLDCYLFHEKHLVPTADDVALRFGERSPTFWRAMALLRTAWQEWRNNPTIQTKFAEWGSLLTLVYGSPVGSEELFLRHTYLALFARVLAFVTLRQQAPSPAEVEDLVLGKVFAGWGLENFVSDDFFTWAIAAERPLRDLVNCLASRLTAAYQLDSVREDLLKGLYQELVDPETRHDLGEFYTPDWLAELTLREAGFPRQEEDGRAVAEQSLLDPACGSGTFLFTAVRLLREAGLKGDNLVSFCQQQLAGVDVHPLAVTIARTNFVLALGEDLGRNGRRFHVPIYMANTLSLPEKSRLQPAICVPVDVEDLAQRTGKAPETCLPREFQLPLSLASDVARLHRAIDLLTDYARPERRDADPKGLVAKLAELGVPAQERHYWHSNLRLMRWLFRDPATDSVWPFILKNAYVPALLAARKFNFVVGNPPWLSYRYIRRRDYQEQVRRLVLEHCRLLDPAEANLFTQMEMATLFFAFSAEHYLRKNGTLAFVMPRSILTGAKQHAIFRERFVSTAKFIIDCEKVTPLFRVPSCVLGWEKRAKAKSARPVRLLRLAGQLPSHNASWEEARACLSSEEDTYRLPRALGQSVYLSRLTNGATIVPRCFWLVRSHPHAIRVDWETPYVETDESEEPKAKPPWKGLKLSGKVEAKFLFATLLSNHMVPFGWRKLSLVLLPLLPESSGRMRLVDVREAVDSGEIHLANWLESAEKLWQKYRKSSVDLLSYLNWQGKLTAQRPTSLLKVLYNTSGTHLCSCVVDPRQAAKWKISRLPVRGFVADTKTYWIETKRAGEAYYLCAVLNAPCVDEAIKPFQTKGAFGSQRGKGQRDIHRRPFEVLPIPEFDSANSIHRELAKLGRRCEQKVTKLLGSLSEKELARPIGTLRQRIRQELAGELGEIDRLVRRLLKLPP